MSYGDFKRILAQIEELIIPHQILVGHKVISAPEILVIIIRFLATGESFRPLSFQFRMSDKIISHIVQEVCNTIIKVLVPRFLKTPSSEKEWKSVTAEFKQCWNFPQLLVAIDDKHDVVKQTRKGGSYYYNYYHMHAIVFMAKAGPNYECLYVDVGPNGRINDGEVWK